MNCDYYAWSSSRRFWRVNKVSSIYSENPPFWSSRLEFFHGHRPDEWTPLQFAKSTLRLVAGVGVTRPRQSRRLIVAATLCPMPRPWQNMATLPSATRTQQMFRAKVSETCVYRMRFASQHCFTKTCLRQQLFWRQNVSSFCQGFTRRQNHILLKSFRIQLPLGLQAKLPSAFSAWRRLARPFNATSQYTDFGVRDSVVSLDCSPCSVSRFFVVSVSVRSESFDSDRQQV